MAALACLAVLACESNHGDVEWVPARRGDLIVGVEVSGTLESIDSEVVKPPNVRHMWRFKIAFLVPEGQE
ncbi:MAG: hypothetical protein KJO07_05775, partial [Deltaproteobacteria bacterium]|nr:hypothetical protein [Deltaproteobacteria bacterium]